MNTSSLHGQHLKTKEHVMSSNLDLSSVQNTFSCKRCNSCNMVSSRFTFELLKTQLPIQSPDSTRQLPPSLHHLKLYHQLNGWPYFLTLTQLMFHLPRKRTTRIMIIVIKTLYQNLDMKPQILSWKTLCHLQTNTGTSICIQGSMYQVNPQAAMVAIQTITLYYSPPGRDEWYREDDKDPNLHIEKEGHNRPLQRHLWSGKRQKHRMR